MATLATLFDDFLRERTYIQNVSPKTLAWYSQAWRAFLLSQPPSLTSPSGAPGLSRADLEHFVRHLRQRGVRPVTCNCWLRALHAFCQWSHETGHSPNRVRIALQRVDRPVLRPFRDRKSTRLNSSH